MDLGIDGLGPATEVGAGASAIVYRSRQVELDREVAVKVLSVTDEAFVRRFRREAKTLGKLSQKAGIVTVYDTGINGSGHPYLILELCEASLLDQLKTDGPFEQRSACRIMAEVAEAVAAAHDGGVIHRDLKPGNVLRSSMGRYMVTDFGISTVTGATMGQTNSVGFTAGYVAPETLTGEAARTPADVYALGATLFHMISGKAPFIDPENNSNLLALAQRVINDSIPDLRPDGVEDGICTVIDRTMAKDPSQRPTAIELAVLLRAVADGQTPDLNAIVGVGPEASGDDTNSNKSNVDNNAGDAGNNVNNNESDGGENTSPAVGPSQHSAAGDDDTATPGLLEVSSAATNASSAPMVDDDPSSRSTNTSKPRFVFGRSNDDATSSVDPPVDKPILAPVAGIEGTDVTVVHSSPKVDVATDDPSSSGGGFLASAATIAPLQPPQDSRRDRRFSFTEDDSRRAPVIVGAAVALVVAIAAIGLLLALGGDDGTGDEVVAGPDIEGNGAEAFQQEDANGRGSLGDRGPRSPVPIPDVVGLGATEATAQLEAAGFEVNRVDDESSSVPIGDVIATDPPAGDIGEPGSTVTMFVSSQRAGETVEVPSVAGEDPDDAQAVLEDVGLRPTIVQQPSSTVADGDVIGTQPEAGTLVNLGSTVEVLVSTGPICADQVGLSEAAATANLEAAGAVVAVTEQSSSSVPEGDVVSCTLDGATATLVVSSPDADTPCAGAVGQSLAAVQDALEADGFTVETTGVQDSAPVGEVTACQASVSTVTLTFSTGSEPTCPDVAGTTAASARSALEQAGFTTVTEETRASETVATGAVISCTASSATAATIVVSSGSAPTEVPDVIGLAVAAATTQIEEAGLTVGATTTVDSEETAGTVLSTSPTAGSSAEPGSTVDLEVSGGPATEVTVPNVIGSAAAVARATIETAGLTATVEERSVGPGASGLVISQTPAAGTAAEPGSTVSIIVEVDGSTTTSTAAAAP